MDRDAYYRQLEAARRAGLALTAQQLREFLDLIEEYADELAHRVSRGLATRSEKYALQVAREIIDELTRDLAATTRRGIVTTARRMEEIHASATLRLMESAGVQQIGALFTGIGTAAAQSVLSRPQLARSFRTIRRESIAAVDRIIKRAVLRGSSNDKLAMELRVHIVGAEALPARLLLDRRRIGYAAIKELGYEPTAGNLAEVRRDTGIVANRARLIARTEPMNIEQEVHARAAADSPVVKALRWKLSHRHEMEDQCDLLQNLDWYSLGPGLYDPRQVPPRPHPRCLCFMLSVLLPVSQWGQARGPLPRRQLDVDSVGVAYGLYPSQIAALAAVLDAAEGRSERAA